MATRTTSYTGPLQIRIAAGIIRNRGWIAVRQLQTLETLLADQVVCDGMLPRADAFSGPS
jgi:hypothetical protein